MFFSLKTNVLFVCLLFRRQFRTVADAVVKLESVVEVIDKMLPKFASKWYVIFSLNDNVQVN